jgi:hypothetical protein
VFLSDDPRLDPFQDEPVIARELFKIRHRVRISQRGPQDKIAFIGYLHRKPEQAAVSQRASHAAEHPRQIADLDEDVGGDGEIERMALRFQELGDVAADQMVVEPTLLRFLEHVRRQVNSGQRAGERPQLRPEKAGAATQPLALLRLIGNPSRHLWR